MATRMTFSVRLISGWSASFGAIRHGTDMVALTLPSSASCDRARRRRRPAITANFPRGSFFTTRPCNKPTAAMESASSPIPPSTPVVRTLSFHASSLLSGISSVCSSSVFMIGSFRVVMSLGCGLRLLLGTGADFQRGENLGSGALNKLKGRGKRGGVAVVELDVIDGGGVGVKSDRVTDYEGNCFRFGLANRLGCVRAAVCAMQFLVHQFVNKHREFLGGWLVRK